MEIVGILFSNEKLSGSLVDEIDFGFISEDKQAA
jgi:hypothetical protein